MTISLPPLRWKESPNYSSRGNRKVDLIVIHDCEGNYAGAVDWFSQARSKVSAHLVLKEDGSEVTQMVDFANKAWHAVAFNGRSIGLEMAGFAKHGFADGEWSEAADVVAFLLLKFGIPPVWAKKGIGPGFASHYDLGAAGGGHSDPTTDPAVWKKFVGQVQTSYALGAPSSWPLAKGLPPLATVPASFVPTPTIRKG